jgi:exodeoxyribonuclease III
MFIITTWNVNGIRAIQKKGFWDNVTLLKSNVISIQETKTDGEKMLIEQEIINNLGWQIEYFSATNRKGYSGVATIVPGGKSGSGLFLEESVKDSFLFQKGLQVPEFDEEGRIVITQHKLPNSEISITLINGYYPQGGRGPHRIEYKIRFYKTVVDLAKKLSKEGHYVLLCGDLNTTVADIDLARPAQNRKTTGCLPQEREALGWFKEAGFSDVFRHFYPDKADIYTYWDQITRARERNVGWRIDYFLADEKTLPLIKDCIVHSEIMGSDHCPVSVVF